MPNLRNDELRAWALIFMLAIGPPVILQNIIEEIATPELKANPNKFIPFMAGKQKITLTESIRIDTSRVGLYCKTFTTYRKNSRDDRHYEAYIVAPINTPMHEGKELWFGYRVNYIDQHDNSSEEEILNKINLLQDTAKHFFKSRVINTRIDKIEINTTTPTFLDFKRAVSNAAFITNDNIVVATESIPRQSIKYKFRVFLITLTITQTIWAIVCLFIRINKLRLDEYLAMDQVARVKSMRSDLVEVFFWITPRKNYLITPILLIINISIYFLMGTLQVGFDSPDHNEMIAWGSNYGPLVLEGQIWRWLTAGFLHFGFIHIMMNMFALGYSGYIMERALGSTRMAILFSSSVIGSSICSNFWYQFQHNTAGSSGGIFGLMGAMLFYALFDIGKEDNRLIMILLFTFFGLPTIIGGLMGLIQVDNAGHIGGMLTGMIMAIFFIRKVNSANDIFENL